MYCGLTTTFSSCPFEAKGTPDIQLEVSHRCSLYHLRERPFNFYGVGGGGGRKIFRKKYFQDPIFQKKISRTGKVHINKTSPKRTPNNELYKETNFKLATSKWLPFGKELPSRCTVCSPCNPSICDFCFFAFLF